MRVGQLSLPPACIVQLDDSPRVCSVPAQMLCPWMPLPSERCGWPRNGKSSSKSHESKCISPGSRGPSLARVPGTQKQKQRRRSLVGCTGLSKSECAVHAQIPATSVSITGNRDPSSDKVLVQRGGLSGGASGQTWLDWQPGCIRGINLRDAARTCSVTRCRRIHCFGSSITSTGNVPRFPCQHRGGEQTAAYPKSCEVLVLQTLLAISTKAKFRVSCSCHCVSVGICASNGKNLEKCQGAFPPN
jgi:hypothetical protein